MKKSIISFLAVMLVIVLLGVSAITGIYLPVSGGDSSAEEGSSEGKRHPPRTGLGWRFIDHV